MRRTSLQVFIGVIGVILVVVGCGAPAATPALLTSLPPTATLTPTATATAVTTVSATATPKAPGFGIVASLMGLFALALLIKRNNK